MADWTLAFDGIVSFATAAVFAYVGLLMQRRVVPDADSRVAMHLFAAWWYSLAAVTMLRVVTAGAALAGVLTIDLYATAIYVTLVPLTVALWGLLYYLVYIYTGNAKWLTPLTGAYIVVYFVLNYLVFYLDPVGVKVEEWGTSVEYARELSPGLSGTFALVLLGPVILAALAYGSLFFTARQRNVRYRVGLVSVAFLFWFGSSLVAGLTGIGEMAWWPIASRVISLVSTLLVLAAYRPPRAISERFGLEAVPLGRAAAREPRLKGAIVTVLLRKAEAPADPSAA